MTIWLTRYRQLASDVIDDLTVPALAAYCAFIALQYASLAVACLLIKTAQAYTVEYNNILVRFQSQLG
jgi:hypothetical protein